VGVAAVVTAVWLVFPAFRRVVTGAADPDWTNYRRLYRLAALFTLFSVMAFVIGHFVHLSLSSF
jgi:hypothetical protein